MDVRIDPAEDADLPAILSLLERNRLPRGFRAVARAEVAPVVRQSVEFTSACPESAQAMMKDL